MKIGILGFGAVGISVYYELKNYKDIYILVDEARKEKYENTKFYVNENLITPNYVTNKVMDLVIVAVKNYDLDNALDSITPFVNKNTILLPLLNGIEAHDKIKERFPFNRVLYGVINIEANKNGNKIKASKIINLQYGDEYNYNLKAPLMFLRKLFNSYKINNNIYHDMKRRMWLKWMLNLGINQYSALYNMTYLEMNNKDSLEYLFNIYDEVYKVAQAYKINLTLDDLEYTKNMCRNFKSNRVTSLTDDVNNKRKDESYYFGHKLISLAEAKNIDVPYNKKIYKDLCKKIEDNR